MGVGWGEEVWRGRYKSKGPQGFMPAQEQGNKIKVAKDGVNSAAHSTA